MDDPAQDPSDLTPSELKARAGRFFDRYARELEHIRELLEIRLSQLALSYTISNNLPPESVVVNSRVKTLTSFLKKLEKKGWPQFYYPTEVAKDLIGARVTCWFIDDCDGIVGVFQSSKHLKVRTNIENYIKYPKPSGYRSIHLLADIEYDGVRRMQEEVVIQDQEIVCEIQVRTKLQDAWGDVTHEFHYKAQTAGVENSTYERILSEISQRLANEDRSILTLRDAYQALADDKQRNRTREGFRDE